MTFLSPGHLCMFDWKGSRGAEFWYIYGSYKDVPRETFFHQKPYAPQVLESLPTTVGPGNKDKTCQPVAMAADAGGTSGLVSKNMGKFGWKTRTVHFIFLPGLELSRTWHWPGKCSVKSTSVHCRNPKEKKQQRDKWLHGHGCQHWRDSPLLQDQTESPTLQPAEQTTALCPMWYHGTCGCHSSRNPEWNTLVSMNTQLQPAVNSTTKHSRGDYALGISAFFSFQTSLASPPTHLFPELTVHWTIQHFSAPACHRTVTGVVWDISDLLFLCSLSFIYQSDTPV